MNELSVEEWEESFGKVYRNHIENGVHSIMAGHIALPEYQKALVPGLEDKDILPATLAPELINGIIKRKIRLQRFSFNRCFSYVRNDSCNET